jgi:hypothetical protein
MKKNEVNKNSNIWIERNAWETRPKKSSLMHRAWVFRAILGQVMPIYHHAA